MACKAVTPAPRRVQTAGAGETRAGPRRCGFPLFSFKFKIAAQGRRRKIAAAASPREETVHATAASRRPSCAGRVLSGVTDAADPAGAGRRRHSRVDRRGSVSLGYRQRQARLGRGSCGGPWSLRRPRSVDGHGLRRADHGGERFLPAILCARSRNRRMIVFLSKRWSISRATSVSRPSPNGSQTRPQRSSCARWASIIFRANILATARCETRRQL